MNTTKTAESLSFILASKVSRGYRYLRSGSSKDLNSRSRATSEEYQSDGEELK
jgi:hypothetical protein